MVTGRPEVYTPELAARFCQEIASGRSLREICRDEEWSPCGATIFLWIREKPDFLKQYEIATEERSEILVDEMLEIADDGRNDWMESHDEDNPGYKANGEHIQRSRLRVDTRKWAASKMKPKKYADRLDHTTMGEKINMAPITIEIVDTAERLQV